MQSKSNHFGQDDAQHVAKIDMLAAVVLHVLVRNAPEAVLVTRVAFECERNPNRDVEREEVQAALEVLVADGLVQRQGKQFSATRPAVRAVDLSF